MARQSVRWCKSNHPHFQHEIANNLEQVIATFAGTAAIQAMILLTYQTELPPPQIVSIPYIDPGSVAGNTTLSAITNLVTNMSSVVVQPAALDTDIDALLAVTVSSFLMMLPYHTWSSAIRANRARHVLIFMWNMLMLGGAVCALVLWPALFDVPLQYRFCYPSMLDKDTFSTGSYASSLPGEDWNSTIWNTFANFNRANNLSSNCIYPSFNTSQILRRPGTIVATIKHTDSARANSELYWAGILALSTSLTNEKNLANLMYIAIIITAVVMVIILVFVLTPIRHITRVPVHKPKELIRGRRVFHVLLGETINGILEIVRAIRSPSRTIAQIRNAPHRTRRTKILRYARYWTDMLALIVLFVAMILTPVTIIIFVVWIEWYIERDLVSTELPAQVGQWTTSVSIGLVLISALVLRLRYIIATKTDIQGEIADAQKHLEFLETLLEKKTKTEHEYRMRSRSIATIRELELADDHGDGCDYDGDIHKVRKVLFVSKACR